MRSNELPIEEPRPSLDERTAPIHRKSRRAAVATMIAGAAGIPAMLTGTFAKPASAESSASTIESPKALVAQFKNEISQMVTGADANHQWLLPQKNYDVHYFLAPNPKDPSVHDFAAISTAKNGKFTSDKSAIVLFTDVEGKKSKSPNAPQYSYSQLNFRPDAQGHADTNALELHVDTSTPSKPNQIVNYLIDDRPGLPADMFALSGKNVEYPVENPKAAKKGYDDFLAYIKNIVKHSLTKQQIIETYKKMPRH